MPGPAARRFKLSAGTPGPAMPDMSLLILLDVAPDPVPVAGARSLVALAVAVLLLGVALIVGFVFLLKRIKRRRAHPLGSTAQSSVINSPE